MFNIYANRYAPLDPLVPPCEINLIPIGYVGEDQVRCLVFDLTDCVQKLGEGTFQISFVRPGDNACYICTNVQRLDDNAIWVITDTDTAYEGYGLVQLMYFPANGGTAKTAQYRTTTFKSNGEPGDAPDPYEGLLEQIAQLTSQAVAAASTATAAADQASAAVESGISTERSQRIAADEDLQVQITSLMGAVGGPLTAATAAAMTDTSKVYVYVGNESGYTYGHWYYYAGANWADGGVYNSTALETDKTLTVEGMAADAAACGDLKSQIYSAFVTESIEDTAIASFDDGADDVPVKDLVVNITPKQAGSGDPSPTNVRAITGWTEANITIVGKNFLPRTINTRTVSGVTFTVNDDGSVSCSGTATAAIVLNYAQNLALDATNKILNGCPSGGSQTTYYLTARINGAWLSQSDYGNGCYIWGTVDRVAIVIQSGVNATGLVFKPMIRWTTDDDTFEPYNGTTYPISFASAGTVYGGTLDVTSGMLTVTYRYITIDGTASIKKEATGYNANNEVFYIGISANKGKFPSATSQAPNIVSNQLQVIPYGSLRSTDIVGAITYTSKGDYLDWISGEATVDAEKARLNTTPLQIAYELENPISYQLSETEVRTLLGNNNIWSDTGSVASLEYRADTGILINKLTNAIVSLGGNI